MFKFNVLYITPTTPTPALPEKACVKLLPNKPKDSNVCWIDAKWATGNEKNSKGHVNETDFWENSSLAKQGYLSIF